MLLYFVQIILPITSIIYRFSLAYRSILAPKFLYKTAFMQRRQVYLYIGLAIAAVIAWQQYTLHHYNNFIIFRTAFSHLTDNKNLYLFYPNEYDDLFLYNPTFAILFSPFSLMPVWLAMLTWTMGNMFLYLYAINRLPLHTPAKLFVLALCLPDCINSLQHQQVNSLNLSLMLLAFVMLRSRQTMLAALFTALVLFIKVYPAAIGLCFLFFPNKIKYLGWCTVWCIFLVALPLLVVPLHGLANQYQNWFASLQADRTVEENATSLSLISINYQWLKNPVNPLIIQLTGLGVTLLPLALKRSLFGNTRWQLTYLAGILLFIIVFNHAAESATYLLAVAGVGLWYVVNTRSRLNLLLLMLVVVLTVLSITDLVPAVIKKEFIQPYSIRAVPCVLVWLKIMYDLLTSTQPNDPQTHL